MNKILMWILIIAGIFVLLLIIPKPYSYNYSSNCHPYPSTGEESGWCIGIIYPLNEEIQKTPDQYAITQNEDYCIDVKKGWECKGFSIFKSGIAIA